MLELSLFVCAFTLYRTCSEPGAISSVPRNRWAVERPQHGPGLGQAPSETISEKETDLIDGKGPRPVKKYHKLLCLPVFELCTVIVPATLVGGIAS